MLKSRYIGNVSAMDAGSSKHLCHTKEPIVSKAVVGNISLSNHMDSRADSLIIPRSRRRVLRLTAGTLAGALFSRSSTGLVQAQYTCDRDSVVFSDGFESGDLAKWDSAEGLSVQKSDVYDGDYAVQADSNGQPRYARTSLRRSYDDLYYRIWFRAPKIPGDQWVYLMKFRTADDDPILSLAIDDNRTLCYRPDARYPDSQYVGGSHSDVYVTGDRWHELQAHIHIDGRDGRVEVWYDGEYVPDLSNWEDLRFNPVGGIQIGESLSARSFDVRFDQVVVATEFCGTSYF